MGTFQLTEATISTVQRAYESSSLTCLELVNAYLDRIEAYDRNGPCIGSVVNTNPRARERAKELDRSLRDHGSRVGPLHGIPILVKDQVETREMPTTFGSVAFREYMADRDARIIELLEDAGAVILGKTNMPDWATGWYGYSSASGRTKNPYDLDRDPGGSSSGTGAAVAANLSTVGIGEDTGGSIRVPSSFNNLFGLRVTPGMISRDGLCPLVRQQDTPGPMARSVPDLAQIMDVLVGYDPDDPYTSVNVIRSNGSNVGSYFGSLEAGALEDARVGILRQGFGSAEEPDFQPVNRVMNRALEVLRDRGVQLVDPVQVPDLEDWVTRTSLYGLQSKRDINEFLNQRSKSPVSDVEEIYENGQYHELHDLFKQIAQGPSDPADHPEYFEKVAARESFQRVVLNTFAEHKLDAILCPDVQIVPPTTGDIENDKWGAFSFPTNTLMASQSGCPAISVPAGFTAEDLPVGMELIGPPFSESNLLGFAYDYEQAVQPRRPPETAPPL